jgi:hypothetical protein
MTYIGVMLKESKHPSMLYESIHPEDGSSTVLRNVGILLYHYTMLEPRRPRHE